MYQRGIRGAITVEQDSVETIEQATVELFSEIVSQNHIEFEKISTKKFLEKERIAESKNIINFNNKICREFIKKSVYNLSLARNIHNEIESIYSSCMDYKKINKITQKLENF